MAAWKLLGVMPNVRVCSAVDAGFLAIVPRDDPRVPDALEASAAKALVERVVDSFNHPIEPSLILLAESHSQIDLSALVALRNAIALASVCDAWANWIEFSGGIGGGTRWSDYFDICPWLCSRDGTELTAFGPELHANIQKPDNYRGTTSPSFDSTKLTRHSMDISFLHAILRVWKRTFVARKESPKSRRLFRSLEVAHQAARVPFTLDYRMYEVGIRLSLWVSAVETLFNPKKANAHEIVDHLKNLPWVLQSHRKARYYLPSRKRKADVDYGRVTLPQKLYGELFRLRNNFLHGNRIVPTRLHAFADVRRRPYLAIAPVLYRTFVMVYLNQYAQCRNLESASLGRFFKIQGIHGPFEKALQTAVKCSEDSE